MHRIVMVGGKIPPKHEYFMSFSGGGDPLKGTHRIIIAEDDIEAISVAKTHLPENGHIVSLINCQHGRVVQ